MYVRPFFDAVNVLGTLTLFNSPTTLYQINGTSYVGDAGLTVLSHLSAGSTMTAAYTNFEPTATLNPEVTAGKFNPTYVIAGSTLEDFYTQGIEGDVIARHGNILTLRGATLQLNTGQSEYLETPDSVVLVGPGTIVTADNNATLTGLELQFHSRRPAHHRARHLFAAGHQRHDHGCDRLSHQYRFGAAATDAAMRAAGILRLGQRGARPADHRKLAGQHL